MRLHADETTQPNMLDVSAELVSLAMKAITLAESAQGEDRVNLLLVGQCLLELEVTLANPTCFVRFNLVTS